MASFLQLPFPHPQVPKGVWCPGLKMAQPNLPAAFLLAPPKAFCCAWLSGDGDAKGPGRGLISSAANRPSSATSYYCTAPPQPPSLAGLRLSAAPGTRHQIGVKIQRVSFAAADGADNRDGMAGGEQRHRGRFSIKASPSQRSSKQEAGQSPHWAGEAGRVL